jgi:Polyketide cyclase / dehydrase and lipid transport.
MKSIVAIEVERPRRQVAMLLANPSNMTKWMDDLAGYDLIDGDPGAAGARFRMVPKPGTQQTGFVSTVTATHLPERHCLRLQSPTVDVLVDTTFEALAKNRTRVVSKEKFIFHGLFRRLFGRFARDDIHQHHREHIESFKQFAENTAQALKAAPASHPLRSAVPPRDLDPKRQLFEGTQ